MFTFVALFALTTTTAQPPCVRDCGGDAECETAVTSCLIEAGTPRRAIERLRPLTRAPEVDAALLQNLARAYLAEGNPFWAQRALRAAVSARPEDCESWSWLAWIGLGQGDLDLVGEALEQPGCPDSIELEARFAILQALAARLAHDHVAARAALERARAAQQVFVEDQALLRYLRDVEDPGWLDPVSARLELSGGASSNAVAGSPTDVVRAELPSALGRVDAFTRLLLPTGGLLRPLVDGLARGHGLAAAEVSDLSYLELSLRPGVVIGRAPPRLLVWYVPDLLLLNSERSLWFYTGHRAELELDLGPWALFAGGGRRQFFDVGRSRYEMDGGLGGSLALGDRVRLLLAASLRYYLADAVVYDQLGGTGLASLYTELWGGASTRIGLALASDWYPSSGGADGIETFGIDGKRLDLQARVKGELWSPPLGEVWLGLGYELALRDSSADVPTRSFDFTEQRAMIKLRWSFSLDPTAPTSTSPAGHVPLPAFLASERGAGFDEGRLQDLLRQEESDLRGLCGCGS